MRRNHIVKKLSILGTTEIRGLDLSEPLDDELIAEIKNLWNKSRRNIIFTINITRANPQPSVIVYATKIL